MTTKITVDVNGRYKATVKLLKSGDPAEKIELHEVHGRYEGSPNPTGQKDFYIGHPACLTLDIIEEYLGEAPTLAPSEAAELTAAGGKLLLLAAKTGAQ